MNEKNTNHLLEQLGFKVDYKAEHWTRYVLTAEMFDLPELKLIVYPTDNWRTIVKQAARIIFKAGQLSKLNAFKKFLELE